MPQESRSALLERWQNEQDRDALDLLLREELEALKRALRNRGTSISSATLDDVAALALFLCSPAARRVTGQAVRIAGHADAA